VTEPGPVGEASKGAPPAGVRYASTLCYVVGILSILIALAVGIPALSERSGSAPLFFLVANIFGGMLACAAGYLVRHQLRIGGLLVVLAWAFPWVIGFLVHASTKGSGILMLIAMVYTLANWKHLH
jgi:hypothetical protein